MRTEKIAIIGIGILFLVSCLDILRVENEKKRILLEKAKAEFYLENCRVMSEATLKDLNHTLNFLGTMEHAMDNYREKMNEYASELAENRAELQRCKENKPEFIWIAERVADAHEWVANVYDCSEFSQDLASELRRNGYRARVVHGYFYGYFYTEGCEEDEEFECRHDWVCLGEDYDYGVCIEATGGYLIAHSQYKKVYEFVGEGKWS